MPVGAPAQRPGHRRGVGGAGPAGRRRAGRRLPVRQRRARGQRLPGHPGHEPVLPRRRPRHRLLRHQRRAPHGRAVQPAPGAPPAPLRRRPGLHRLLRLAPGRHQEGLRRSGAAGRRHRGGAGRAAVAHAVPAGGSQGRGTHLRGGGAGQQPVGQGRRGLRDERLARPQPAARVAGGPGRPGAGTGRDAGRRAVPRPDRGPVPRGVPLPGRPVRAAADRQDAPAGHLVRRRRRTDERDERPLRRRRAHDRLGARAVGRPGARGAPHRAAAGRRADAGAARARRARTGRCRRVRRVRPGHGHGAGAPASARTWRRPRSRRCARRTAGRPVGPAVRRRPGPACPPSAPAWWQPESDRAWWQPESDRSPSDAQGGP